MNKIFARDKVFWYLNLETVKPLRKSLSIDVLVAGGGMAGLSTAQSFYQK